MWRFLIPVLVLVTGCTKSTSSAPPLTPAQQGRKIYSTHCIACHGGDPHVDGSIGPAIFGSALDLLEVRLQKGQYPPGYKPKRPTHIMPLLPFLKDDIPALHAYLNSP